MVIEFLAHLAWSERLDALLRISTPSHKFVVNRNGGISGQQMQDWLKRHGVKIWDRNFTRDTLSFRVKREQAKWSEYLLHQLGVTIYSPPSDPRSAAYGPLQSHWEEEQRGFFDELLSSIFG